MRRTTSLGLALFWLIATVSCRPGGSGADMDQQMDLPRDIDMSVMPDGTDTADADAEMDTVTIEPATDPRDARQHVGLQGLAAASPDAFDVQLAPGGRVVGLTLDVAPEDIGLPEVGYLEETVLAWVEREADVLRLSRSRSGMIMVKRRFDGPQAVVTLRPTVDDVPVYGAWIQVRAQRDPITNWAQRLQSIGGRYSTDFPDTVSATPTLSANAALDMLATSHTLTDRSQLTVAGAPTLWFVDPALLADTCPTCPAPTDPPRLTWRVAYATPSNGLRQDAFVDAHTGALVLHKERSAEVDVDVENAHNVTSQFSDCWTASTVEEAWYDEDGVCSFDLFNCTDNACADGWGCPAEGADGAMLRSIALTNNDYFQSNFGRTSFDNNDGEYEIYANVDFNGRQAMHRQCLSPAAYDFFEISPGNVNLDSVSHEIGHAYHLSEVVDDVVTGDAGKVFEHIPDVHGILVSNWSGQDPDWVMGEEADPSFPAGNCVGFPRAFRNAADPSSCGHPDHMMFMTPTTGGHAGGAMLSKVWYLFVEGDIHNAVTITGMGHARGRQLFNRFLTHHLTANPSFADYRKLLLDACDDLAGNAVAGMNAGHCCQVGNALATVGIGPLDTNCDGVAETPLFDTDDDFVADNVDNCVGTVNPGQLDTDGDGAGDACENDDDNDGVLDGVDLCPLTADALQVDTDMDGIGDACDDSDGDGIVDAIDNCPAEANPSQTDSDNDMIGNVCDTDLDNDGLMGTADNCPIDPNPLGEDGDMDGVGDVCDNCPMQPNADQANLDGDARGDLCDPDRDGDGLDNLLDPCPDEHTMSCISVLGDRPTAPWLTRSAMASIPAEPFGPRMFWVLPIDPCAMVPDCESRDVFEDGTQLTWSGTVTFQPEQGRALIGPMEAVVSITTDTGRILGRRDVTLTPTQGSAGFTLTIEAPPAIAAYDTRRNPDAGHPALTIALGVDMGVNGLAETQGGVVEMDSEMGFQMP